MLASLCLGMPARAAEPDWPDAITIATASPGGTYYVYGEGLAKILTRRSDPVSMRPTEGPAENIKLIEAGEAQVGFVTMGVAQQGVERDGGLDRWQAVSRHARDVPDV